MSGALVGVYLHGSAVLGDWHETSDVDVLVVMHDGPSREERRLVASRLVGATSCPRIGLEASVVEARAARHPAEPWPFLVHVNTCRDDRRTTCGSERAADRDLILHYVVTRASGWSAYGDDPRAIIGAVPREVVLAQFVHELSWAVEHASNSYAVFAACRGLRYRDEGVVCSKTDAGRWALEHELHRALVRESLDERRNGVDIPARGQTVEWLRATAEELC